jgi:hypothetical protein
MLLLRLLRVRLAVFAKHVYIRVSICTIYIRHNIEKIEFMIRETTYEGNLLS